VWIRRSCTCSTYFLALTQAIKSEHTEEEINEELKELVENFAQDDKAASVGAQGFRYISQLQRGDQVARPAQLQSLYDMFEVKDPLLNHAADVMKVYSVVDQSSPDGRLGSEANNGPFGKINTREYGPNEVRKKKVKKPVAEKTEGEPPAETPPTKNKLSKKFSSISGQSNYNERHSRFKAKMVAKLDGNLKDLDIEETILSYTEKQLGTL
jgi:hypothetical protein